MSWLEERKIRKDCLRDDLNEMIGRKEKKKGKTHLESLSRKIWRK